MNISIQFEGLTLQEAKQLLNQTQDLTGAPSPVAISEKDMMKMGLPKPPKVEVKAPAEPQSISFDIPSPNPETTLLDEGGNEWDPNLHEDPPSKYKRGQSKGLWRTRSKSKKAPPKNNQLPPASVPAPPVASVPAPPVASVPAPPVASVPAPPVASVPAPPVASVPASPATEEFNFEQRLELEVLNVILEEDLLSDFEPIFAELIARGIPENIARNLTNVPSEYQRPIFDICKSFVESKRKPKASIPGMPVLNG